MVITGLLIGAVQLVPLFEVGRVNFREGASSFEEVRGWAYPPRNALTFLLPNFFGNPTHHTVRDAFTGQDVSIEQNFHDGSNPYGPYTTSWGAKNYVEGAAYLAISTRQWAEFRAGKTAGLPAKPISRLSTASST